MQLERSGERADEGERLLDAYRAGFTTYEVGMPLTLNPYPRYSEENASWERGWHTAVFGSKLYGNI